MVVLLVLVWLVAVAKVPALFRNRHDPPARAYWLALLSVALVVTFDTEPVYLWLGSRLPNLAIPLSAAAGVSAGYWCQSFLGEADRTWWRIWPAAAMGVVIVACYPFGAGTHPNSFAMINSPPMTWGELVMGLCLAVWAGYVLLDIGRSCLRFAASAERGALRMGMVVATLGLPLIGAWVIVEYGPYGLWSWRDPSPAPTEHTLIEVLTTTGLLGFAAVTLGLGRPAIARRIQAAHDWGQDLRSYLLLGRLWHTVRPAVPTLDWPRYRLPLVHRLMLVDLPGRLYRRVVEIQDGFFALQPYRDAGYERHLASAARPGSERAARARLDAYALLRAVSSFEARRRPDQTAPPAPQELLDDVGYLAEVSRALPRESATDGGDIAVQPLE